MCCLRATETRRTHETWRKQAPVKEATVDILAVNLVLTSLLLSI